MDKDTTSEKSPDVSSENWRSGNNEGTSTRYSRFGRDSKSRMRTSNQREGFSRGRFENTNSNRLPNNNRYNRSGSRPTKSMGFMFLEDLSKNDPEKIILTLTKEREGFTHLLEKELTSDVVVLILRILKKVASSTFNESKYKILHSSFQDKFVNKLQTFIACLPTQSKRTSTYFWKDPNEFWTNLLDIGEDFLHTTPTFACKTFSVLLKSFKIYIPVIELEQNVFISEDIKKKAETMRVMIENLIKENEEKLKGYEKQSEQTIEPPDDFRQISVYPSAEEIVGGRGFLKENVVKGPYHNVNHYLDVQFRLLREDFVGPLRDGIANYRSSSPTNQLENVKVHKGVQFLKTETINEFYCIRVQFTNKKKKIPNFENSRRFMYGSLLCFTKDNFQNLIFGKVGQRKIEDLQNGQVIVAFDEQLDVDYNSNYLMVECNVYFEPYFHVLTVLKNMSQENFPMERYIIRVNPSVQAPEYLDSSDCYKIESVEFNPIQEWPNEPFYNLNESQMVAFKAAITQEIAVIQGPPGTGKTYLGLKIAETLLRNIRSWYNYTPMLVICFTNHALDQFLEGLIPITNKIVRVGGQSKNTRLDIYNLRNKTERDDAVAIKRREVQYCLSNIKQITEKLQQIDYYNSILSFNNFQESVPDIGSSWFATAKQNAIIHWLLEGAVYEQTGYQRRGNLDFLQAQDEFNRIGINDDIPDERQRNIEEDLDFNAHILSNWDSIFDEIFIGSNVKSQHSFLLTLNAMREELRRVEDALMQLRKIENPSLQELIREEEMYLYLNDLRQKYEYTKRKLSEGRNGQGVVEEPGYVDLRNPYKMNFDDRWKLYFYWLNLFKKRESDVLKMTCEDFPSVYKEYEELRQIEDVRTMKESLVVGMTTTSAARLRASLQTLKNPIVIVEEAAEVLEAHIVTSITKHCKHLILIGDHKQLKPNTANYGLDKKYHLGISLFERMIINDIHCYTLNVQHRMRPEISSLIRPAIYDFLEDHPSVHQRPVISGIDNCIFFIDHEQREESCEGSSKVNYHEVTFLISLARHLVLNGYNPENITILAAYLGQFFEFRKMRKSHLDLLEGINIAVLDNYQGEESDIILLSLVRNNDENKIGFLSIENRVCVALSRARNAMYIMGNMSQLCNESKLWRKIRSTLEKQNALGSELPLRCQIHDDQVTKVKCESDFYSVSEGGCRKKCDMELKCGHKCSYLCHIRDRSHTYYKCQTICNKPLCKKDDTHLCKKMCYEDCGPCTYMVTRILACNHEVTIPCHVDTETYKCQVEVPTILPCGHKTDKPCSCDPKTYRCPHMCDVQVQPCGHACIMLCHVRKDPEHLEYQCKKPCTKYMKDCSIEDEDHRCKKLCYQDCDPCTITVRKQRTICSHVYDVPCNFNVDELDCEKPCVKVLNCGHRCKGRCNQPCKPCYTIVYKVNPICKHSIKVKCCEPADRKFCTKPCPLKLPCGHPCTQKCNEQCTLNCTELVDCHGIVAECGHLVTRMECHMRTSHVDKISLLKYCKEPCKKELKCGHLCSGTCGDCFQGRVHKRCSEKCGALLVCDHQCDFPCRQACRPCKQICEYRCEHSKCKKFCGEICTSCKEVCSRRCSHLQCKKFCGDICSVLPCTKPCLKMLQCGHECIGFCGDPCPPKCLVCNKDELLEVFFGTESENSRYVLLNDCKHIVENDGMEKWLQQDRNQISYKVCPMCKTAIRTTKRYSDYIKRAIMDVAIVKGKVNGRAEEIAEKRREIEYILKDLNARSQQLNMYCPQLVDVLKSIKNRIQSNRKGKRPNINIYEVRSLKSKLQIITHIINICCNNKVIIRSSREIFIPQVNFILDVLSRDIDYITDQEIEDVRLEIDRLSRLVEFSSMQNSAQFSHYAAYNEEAKTLIAIIEKSIFSFNRFTDEYNKALKTYLTQLNDTMKCGIAISDQEKKEILQAMGFSKGHWFKCPNGHVYAIGECGGAMEESKCNECGAKIGGSNHRLLASNAVAGEMDGARHEAWSVGANLRNYDMEF